METDRKVVIQGAEILLDGRNVSVEGFPDGNFLGPTLISKVKPHMQAYLQEIFGPVLVCLEVRQIEASSIRKKGISRMP